MDAKITNFNTYYCVQPTNGYSFYGSVVQSFNTLEEARQWLSDDSGSPLADLISEEHEINGAWYYGGPYGIHLCNVGPIGSIGPTGPTGPTNTGDAVGCIDGFANGQPCVPAYKRRDFGITTNVDENGIPDVIDTSIDTPTDVVIEHPEKIVETPTDVVIEHPEKQVMELTDPNLQLALEYYVELDCPDLNINCLEGIDSLQQFLQDLYGKIVDSYRKGVNEIEIKLAELLTYLESKYTVGVSQLESQVNNFYFNIVFNPETTLLKIENHIDQLCKEKEIIHVEKILSHEDQTDEDDIEDVSHDGDIEHTEHIKSNGDSLVRRDEKVLPICCDKLPPIEISLKQSQLDQILQALSNIVINFTKSETKVDKVDQMVCNGRDKNEDEYLLSPCYDSDLQVFDDTKHATDKWRKRDEEKITVLTMEEDE